MRARAQRHLRQSLRDELIPNERLNVIDVRTHVRRDLRRRRSRDLIDRAQRERSIVVQIDVGILPRSDVDVRRITPATEKKQSSQEQAGLPHETSLTRTGREWCSARLQRAYRREAACRSFAL